MEYWFILPLASVIAILIYAFTAKRIGMSFGGWLIAFIISLALAATAPLWILRIAKIMPSILAIAVLGVIVCVLSMLIHIRKGNKLNKIAWEQSVKSNKSHPMNPKYNQQAVRLESQNAIELEDYIMNQFEPLARDYAIGYSSAAYEDDEGVEENIEENAQYDQEDAYSDSYGEYYPVYPAYQDDAESDPPMDYHDAFAPDPAFEFDFVEEIVNAYSGRVEEFLSDILNIDVQDIARELVEPVRPLALEAAPRPIAELDEALYEWPFDENASMYEVIELGPIEETPEETIEEHAEAEPIEEKPVEAETLSRSAVRQANAIEEEPQEYADIEIDITEIDVTKIAEAYDEEIIIPAYTEAEVIDAANTVEDSFEQLLMLAFNAKMLQNWDEAAELFARCKVFDLNTGELQMIDVEILNALMKAKNTERAIRHLFALLSNNYPFTQEEKDDLTMRMHELSRGEEY